LISALTDFLQNRKTSGSARSFQSDRIIPPHGTVRNGQSNARHDYRYNFDSAIVVVGLAGECVAIPVVHAPFLTDPPSKQNGLYGSRRCHPNDLATPDLTVLGIVAWGVDPRYELPVADPFRLLR
jgi:hypothetical protein